MECETALPKRATERNRRRGNPQALLGARQDISLRENKAAPFGPVLHLLLLGQMSPPIERIFLANGLCKFLSYGFGGLTFLGLNRNVFRSLTVGRAIQDQGASLGLAFQFNYRCANVRLPGSQAATR